MASRAAILILVIALGFSFGYILESNDPTENVEWPTEYHFSGEKIDLKTGYNTPFEIWYSLDNNRSRIDYYGGMVKKYYYGENDTDSGTMYMIHPETTEDETNEMKCYSVTRDSPQYDFLPDSEDFIFFGNDIYDGKEVQVWKSVTDMGEQGRTEELVYVYRTDQGISVPVLYVEKMYDLWNGELKDHVITNYFNFKSMVELQDLDASQEEDCDVVGVLGNNLEKDLKFLHPDVAIDVDTAFHSYKRHHNRNYENNEHKVRQSIFKKNWRRVVNHNRKNLGYKLTLNRFADRTDAELQYLTGTRPSDPRELGTIPFPHTNEELEALVEEIPDELDLRMEGYITPVKNQASCGSCWAFSTTAAVEAALVRNYGKILDLSEQSLVDCAWGFDNSGCHGGLLDGALKYVMKHGIPTEWEYGTYMQQDGYCHIANITDTHKIRGFTAVTSNSATALKVALNKYGPVTAAIHASENMKLYSNGVFYDQMCEGERVNHGVVVVGYGVRDGTEYWIVKNSWGEDWGEDGFILMSAENNNCNLMDTTYYPIV